MSQPSSTTFAEPPVGADGLIDIFAVANRISGSPEVRPSGVDLAALDRDTPAAASSPFAQAAPAPVAAPQVDEQQLLRLVNEVAAEQSGDPDPPDGAVRVDLLDAKAETTVGTFVVLGGDDWPTRVTSWMRDPEKWYDWAMAVLATDDDRDLWRAVDPTNRQTGRFINDFLIATGSVSAPKGQR